MDSGRYFLQKCPTCGRGMRIQVRYMGMTLTCPHCLGRFVAKDASSVFDEVEDPSASDVSNILQKIETHLQKSGVLS